MSKHKVVYKLLVFFLLIIPCYGQSLSNHYVQGVEGIKAAYPPPLGLYVRSYSYFYQADQLNDSNGNKLNLPFKYSTFAQAERFSYVTPYQVLGGNYGMGLILPFVANDAKIGPNSQSEFGLSDIYVEPVIFGWKFEHFDVLTTSGFFAPTGRFDPTNAASVGRGYWTGMYTLGANYYPLADKTWSISVLNRLEFSSTQQKTNLTPGNGEGFEWGVAHTVYIHPAKDPTKAPPDGIFDYGFAGYASWQFTSGSGPVPLHPQDVVGFGPELNYTMPKENMALSIRFEHEFDATSRPQGNTLNITFTTKLW